MRVALIREFDFHAAHRLDVFGEEHPCSRMHGHTFRCEVLLEGEVDPAKGYLVDFADVKRAIAPIEAQLDHATLNDVPGLENPTTEMVAKWVYDRLRPALPMLAAVRLYETPRNGVEYRGA